MFSLLQLSLFTFSTSCACARRYRSTGVADWAWDPESIETFKNLSNRVPYRIEINREFTKGIVKYIDGRKVDVSENVENNALLLQYLVSNNNNCNTSIDNSVVIDKNILESSFNHIEGSNSDELKYKLLRFNKGLCNIFLPYFTSWNTFWRNSTSPQYWPRNPRLEIVLYQLWGHYWWWNWKEDHCFWYSFGNGV